MLKELSTAMISILRPPAAPPVPADKRIGEREGDQQQQSHAQGQQKQVAQSAVLDGALGAPLEEHQRTEGMRSAAVLAQQMDPKRQPDGHGAG